MAKIKYSFASLIAFMLLGFFVEAQNTGLLPRSVPEAEGVSSEGITNFISAISKSNQEWHSFMLLRHGKVIAEGWWNPYKPGLKHSMYSVSKSFTSTAIGFAVSEKKLSVEDKVITFFPKDLPDTLSAYLSQLTLKHLLIMSTGHDPEPTINAAYGNKSWVSRFLQTPLAYEPSTKFLYNTLATYMLSAIVQKATGQKVMDYLTPRLFEPLGIKEIDWEVSPEGITAGGFGLNLKTEDMAKFGQFCLQKGSWNGKQLVSPQWIGNATTTKIDPMPTWVAPNTSKDSSDWMQGYGYQFWRCRNNAFRADGLAGQFIIVMPDQDAVLAITAEVADMQKELNLVWKYLLPAMHKDRMPTNEKGAAFLKQQLSLLAVPLSSGSAGHADSKNVSGNTFEMLPNEKQIKTLSFDFIGDTCMITIKTDSADYDFAFGSGIWLYGKTMKPGPYLVANLIGSPPFKVAGSFSWKDAGTLEFVLRYVETPHSEKIICRFEEDNILVEIISSKSNIKKIVLKGKIRN